MELSLMQGILMEIEANIMKKLFALLTLCSLLTLLIVACGSSAESSSSEPNTVHMSDSNFVQRSITIKKGESVNLVNDAAVIHIIANGSWNSNGTAEPALEAGAPKVEAEVQGNATQSIGPFNTVGTYHLYCSVHPGMNLTISVQ
jgi:plastocyanin